MHPTRHRTAASAATDVDSETLAKCQRAKELENIGNYEGAREALAGLWAKVGKRPTIEGLALETQGEVLLRAGTLSGYIGSARQIVGAQAFAKDLISESMRTFTSAGNAEKGIEAQIELAVCYWREGAMDEARIHFQEARSHASTTQNIVRILVNHALVEIFTDHIPEAHELLRQAGPLTDQIEDEATLGRYHSILAVVYKRLGGPENVDRALIENAAASIHFENANHTAYFASVENNMGGLLLDAGRYEEAHAHLNKARSAFLRLRELTKVAQVNETRARVFLAQKHNADACSTAFAAVTALEPGDERSLLAEALRTYGIALARTERHTEAMAALSRAADIARAAGNTVAYVDAQLIKLEELRNSIPAADLVAIYLQADEVIDEESDNQMYNRLRACAHIAMDAMRLAGMLSLDHLLHGGNIQEEVRRHEGELIKLALEQTGGSVTRSAKLLGVTHQGLSEILSKRHKNLRVLFNIPARVRRSQKAR